MIRLYVILISLTVYGSLVVVAVWILRFGFPFELVLFIVPGTLGVTFFILFEAIRQWLPEKEKQHQIPLYEKVIHISVLVVLAFTSLELFVLEKLLYVVSLSVVQIAYSIYSLHRIYMYSKAKNEQLKP